MFTDESSDSDVAEGISWDLWKETINEKFFGSSTVSVIPPIPLDAVAMPCQKAVCYGYYPSYEVDSMQLIECKACGTVLKQIGYGHHLRTRHARAKSPSSLDECQTFLLSPPHVASPHQLEVDTPSSSFAKEPIYSTSANEEAERIFATQYSIEQRDELKLALRVSRRELSQVSHCSTSYAAFDVAMSTPATSPVMEPRKHISSSSKKTANGKIRSKKKKKKRRPESSSSDDFSLDHFRSKRRLDDSKKQDSSLMPSTSGINDSMLNSIQENTINDQCIERNGEDAESLIKSESCKDAEERSSESPDLLLADLLNPQKKLALQSTYPTGAVRARLRSLDKDVLTNSTYVEQEQASCAEEMEADMNKVLSSPNPYLLEQPSSNDIANCSKNEPSYEHLTSFTSFTGDEEEPPVLKPEVYFTKSETHNTEEEPLVVEACGSNTYVLSSKVKKKIVNSNVDVAFEPTSMQPINEYPTTSSDCISEVTTTPPSPSTQYFFYSSEVNMTSDPNYKSCTNSAHCSLVANDREINMRGASAQGFIAPSNGIFEKTGYLTTLHSYPSGSAKSFDADNVHSEQGQGQPIMQQRTYCTANVDLPYEISDVACTSKVQHPDVVAPASVSFPIGSVPLGRDANSSIYSGTRRRTERENTIILRRQPIECQQRSQRSHNVRPTVTFRKSSHRVLRHPSTVTLDLSNVPRRRMVFTQRKHEEYRYANTRVAIAKILGTPVECPGLHKRLSPLVCTEDVQFESCRPVGEVCLASTSGLTNGHASTSEELLSPDSYIMPLSKEPPFLLKSGESMNSPETSNSVRGDRCDFINEEASIDSSDLLDEEDRHSKYVSRTVHVPASAVPGTHFIGGQHVVHVFSEPHLSSSAYYSPSDNMFTNALPPPLSPQQSPSGFQFSEVIPEPGSSRLIASEYGSSPSQGNSWDIINYSGDAGQLSRQTNRKVIENPPVLKRMLTPAVESRPLEGDLSEETVSFSGQMRCFMRQHSELGESSDVVFPNILGTDDSSVAEMSTFGHLHAEEAEVLPVVQKTGVCRVGGGSVSLKPAILASGTKRYRLLPSVKGTPYSGSTVYAQSSQNNFRLSAATVPYFDGRYVGRSVQDAVVSNTVAAGRRVTQRSSASIPVLDRFSSTTQLSGVSNLCNVSQTSIQSTDAGCVSPLASKTRMC